MNSKNKMILLVEDDDVSRATIAFKLRLLKINVDEAKNGAEALDRMRVNSYALILLDLRLPVKDGFQVLKEMGAEEQLKHIPVWVLSNLGQKEDIDRAMQLGAREYFIKANLNLHELTRKIADFLKDKE